MSFRTKISSLITNQRRYLAPCFSIALTFLLVDGLGYFILRLKIVRPYSNFVASVLGQSGWDQFLNNHRFYWQPFTRAWADALAWAVSDFAGSPYDSLNLTDPKLTLVLMLTSYIISPVVFLYLLRDRYQASGSVRVTLRLILIQVLIGLSGYILIWAFIPVIPGFQLSTLYARNKLHNDQLASIQRDIACASVADLACQAQVYHAKYRTFITYNDSAQTSRTDRRRDQSMLSGRGQSLALVPNAAALDTILEAVTSDSLVIWCTSDMAGVDDAMGIDCSPENRLAFKNRNGRIGRIQVHASVTPTEIRVVSDN